MFAFIYKWRKNAVFRRHLPLTLAESGQGRQQEQQGWWEGCPRGGGTWRRSELPSGGAAAALTKRDPEADSRYENRVVVVDF